MLGREVVKRQQLVQVISDLRGSLGELRPVGALERLRCGPGVVLVLGVPDLGAELSRAAGSGTTVSIGLYLPDRRANAAFA